MIKTLVRHGLLCKLRVRFRRVRDERHAAGIQDARALNGAPFGEVPRDDLLDVVGDVDAADVDGAVLAQEGADAAHVVAVVGVLLAPEDVDVRVVHVVDPREAVQVLALAPLRAEAAREEEAEEGAVYAVGFRVPGVFGDVAAAGCECLGEVLVFAVAAGPLVVPDVEDCTCLGRRLGGYGARVDLWARWAPFLANDLLDFAFLGRGYFL